MTIHCSATTALDENAICWILNSSIFFLRIDYFLCAHLKDAVRPEVNTDGCQVAESGIHTSKDEAAGSTAR